MSIHVCILQLIRCHAFCFLHDAQAFTFREIEGTASSLAESASRGRDAGDIEGAPVSFACDHVRLGGMDALGSE